MAAGWLLDQLRTSHRGEMVCHLEALCVAYIELANWNVDQYKKETSKTPNCCDSS